MNTVLHFADFASISPLVILLIGALLLILIESFSEVVSRKGAFYVTLAVILVALWATFNSPPVEHPMLAPWLQFDAIGRYFTALFLCIGLGVACLSSTFFQRFEASRGEFYFLLISSIFGLILIATAVDFLVLFLGLETLSIALYILCCYMKKWSISQEAAVKYFLMGSIAAAILLYGIALIYGATGTTHFNALLSGYQGLHSVTDKTLFLSGIALVTMGIAFKAAIVPFHVWAPDVYEGSSTPVTAFMAVGTKAGAFAAFVRLFFGVLPQFDPVWNEGIAWLAYLTLIYANFLALRQTQLRRFFAYSGISHAGFLLIPLAAGTPEALPALLFYLVVYVIATLGCFAVLAFLDERSEGVVMQDLHGLFKRSPVLAGIFIVCLLTLGGIPPTVGFFAKFYVFKVAFQAGYYGLIIVGLLTTILSAYYYLRIIAMMLSEAPSENVSPLYSWPAAAVGVISCTLLVLLSCYPAPLFALLNWGT
ncbi:NADH-quinone oxidoreductase subunit N [Parachlamydia acanthamoebae UV-7]|uniref:NADH-quinone oxidoreductase subunit N n=2 Tax=Parachlamydia acanthamoebae TaxID=83552 RepID=F8KV75_PARAV|nr:NADH-quinone oxidoreductase subunit N [Parachlamydia acanthamoebae]CCB87597.1 NADH-quinone oxidoreductase subunit N [Parachlamydia acanthamoebae UV-7]